MERNSFGRRESVFATFQKMDSDKYFHAKNFIVWSWIQFFNQRNELYREKQYQFLPPFKKQLYPGKNFQIKFSVWYEFTFSNQRNEIYVEEDIQFLPSFIKQIIQVKTSIPQIQCLKWIYFFQPKKQNVRGSGRRLSIFATFQKTNYPGKNFHAKKFSVSNWINFFQPKEQNLCGRKLSIFATF